jgi:trigger factor
VVAPRLPEIDETFAEKLGIREGGVEALRQEIKTSMIRNLEQSVHTQVREQVMDALLAANPITLPTSLVENEVKTLFEKTKANLARQGVKTQEISLDQAQLMEQARKRVALSLILGTIIEKQGIKVDAEKIKQRITGLAASYEDPEEFARWVFSDRERISEIEGALLEVEIVNWMLDQVEVLDEAMSFEDVVNSHLSTAGEKIPS